MTFDDAIRAARRSSVRRFKTGAAIYDFRGNLLAIGWSHPSAERWTATPFSMHAEHHAIARLVPGADPRAIVIATISKKGNITVGRPCADCARLILRAGIGEVTYTQRSDT